MKRSFDVLYEDKDRIAVTKKSGLLTIAKTEGDYHNLYHYVRDYLNRKKQKCFIVHRLDRDTSGIVLFAKSIARKEKLQSVFESQEVGRFYEAVIVEDRKEPLHIEQFINYNKKSGRSYVTKDRKEGKLAITDIIPDHKNDLGTTIKIKIETGRQNQIRLAIASSGYTLLGDKKYSRSSFKRRMLNEYRIILPKDKFRKNVFYLKPLWLKRDDSFDFE